MRLRFTFRHLFAAVLLASVVAPTHGATILVSDGESISTAIASAGDNDTIQIDSDGPFVETLNIAGISGLTIEAAAGRTPIVEGNSATDWVSQAFGLGGTLVNLESGPTLRGIHFRIDLTGLDPVTQTDPNGILDDVVQGYQVLRVASGASGATVIENCNFEFAGTAGSDPLVLGRDMVRVEGASTATFRNCEFRYRNMNLTPWPAFNNTLVYFIPSAGTLVLNVINCAFDMVADMVPDGARARSFGNGNNDAGNAIVVLDGCRFGLNRRDHSQRQQAWISPGGNTEFTARRCDFPNGAGRFYGGGVGMDALLEACTFRHTWGAGTSVLCPDPAGPDAGTRVTCVNCWFSFISNVTGDNAIARSSDGPDSGGQGRGFAFRNCTFHDLSGTRAEAFIDFSGGQTATAIVNVDNDSPEIEFTNCLFNVPGWTRHIIKNHDTPGTTPTGGVIGSGNLIHSQSFPLVDGILPDNAFAVTNQDPLLAPNGIHLLEGSPAIDAAIAGEASDIDGDGLVGGRDIGADERGGADNTSPFRTITFPGDASSFRQALAMANGNSDTIKITDDGPFFGKIRTRFPFGGSVSSKLTVQAADGVNPMFVVDSDEDLLTEETCPDGVQMNCAPFAVCFDLQESITVNGAHFRLDITDAAILDFSNPTNASRILLKTQGREMEAIFNDCIFEVRGNVERGSEIVYGGRSTCRHEGNTRNVFNRCHWQWDQELYFFPAFQSASAYLNPTPPPDGQTTVIEMIYNDCLFDVVPDFGVKARHITANGGGGGEVNLEVNRCIFGTNRERFNEPLDPSVNRQTQQAAISPGTAGTTTVVTDSVFLDGFERQFGSDPAITTGIFINNCVMEATTKGFSLEPDPGSIQTFVLTNTVMRWDSRTRGDDGPFDAPVRGEAVSGDRGITWIHCLLQDVAGEDGKSNVNIMNFDNFSGFTGGITSLTNCIVDAPAMGEALFVNFDQPGELPLNTDNPAGSGNLLNTNVLALQIFPEASIMNKGDPELVPGDGGPAGPAGSDHDAEEILSYHLSECSLLAIDQVDGATGVTTDIDGEARPIGADYDIGPDEFASTPANPEDCVEAPTGACCTDGVCTDATQADCEVGDGTYEGDGVVCGDDTCPVGTPFRRGDHDGSGAYDLTDALNLLSELFLGTFPTKCNNASDFDNSGIRDISDPLNGLAHLFLGTVGIASPGPGVCGLDPTDLIPAGTILGITVDQSPIDLGCDEYPNPDFLPTAACP